MRGWGVTRVNDPASVKLNYSERMKFDVTRSRRLRVTLAILLIVIPVCLITCGPADAIDLAANHDSLPKPRTVRLIRTRTILRILSSLTGLLRVSGRILVFA